MAATRTKTNTINDMSKKNKTKGDDAAIARAALLALVDLRTRYHSLRTFSHDNRNSHARAKDAEVLRNVDEILKFG